MMEDIAADDRLSLWVSEHQVEQVGDVSDQAETIEASIPAQPEVVEETVETPAKDEEMSDANEEESAPVISTEGWKTREGAYDWGAYVLEELIKNGYGGLEVSVILPEHGDRYQVVVLNAEGSFYCLVCEDDMTAVVAMARNRTLFAVPGLALKKTPCRGEMREADPAPRYV